MSVPPFDPDQAAGSLFAGAQARASQDQPLSVSAINRLIEQVLDDGMPSTVTVVGQLVNFTPRGHWYFTLRDEHASLGCVMWSSAVKKLQFEPSEGQELVATGSIGHYAPQGRTQLLVRRLEPVGAGSIQQAFKELCARLRVLGWFDEETKKDLPMLPSRVAIVTSRTSAALADCIETASVRCPAVDLLVVDVRVQGEQAAGSIAATIRMLGARSRELGIDVIVVTRGGGSREELATFDDERIAAAVHDSPIPIVAAIGHESDTTIIELVADSRASTPTQAIMQVVPDRSELQQHLDHLGARLNSMVRRELAQKRAVLQGISRAEVLSRPQVTLDRAGRWVDQLRHRFIDSIAHRLAGQRHRCQQSATRFQHVHPRMQLRSFRERLDQDGRLFHAQLRSGLSARRRHLDSMRKRLQSVGPMEVLGRGYSISLDSSGRPLGRAEQVTPGAGIRTILADGSIDSTVDQVHPGSVLDEDTASK